MQKLCIYFMLLIALTACGSSEPEELILLEGEQADEVADFLLSYKENMIESVNTGDFNKLEPYLITNNSFYHSLRRYSSDLHGERSTKELDHFDVQAVYEDEIGEIHSDVDEVVTLYEHGEEKKISRKLRFELVRGGDDSFRIVTIKERK
ncbi:TcaA NTF2-like domain-containing protein [Halalkalibacter flavus]|uniref:TcaA NTF2-like domain-containing protein n=1 Tax=Halalkalibacter flavus TaxID=3090668 RepID=UPI002FC90BA2